MTEMIAADVKNFDMCMTTVTLCLKKPRPLVGFSVSLHHWSASFRVLFHCFDLREEKHEILIVNR